MNEAEAKALFRQAADVYKDGDHKDALKLFDRLDAEFPNNARIMYPRARCFAKLGRIDEAVALCNTLVTQFGHESALTLMSQLQPNEFAADVLPPALEDTAFDPLDLNVDEKLSSAFDRPPVATQSRQWPSPMIIGAVAVGAVVVILGILAVFGNSADSDATAEDSSTVEVSPDTGTANESDDVPVKSST